MVVAKGSIRITGNINGDDLDTPALEVLVIVSGCHIIVGECVIDHYAYDPSHSRLRDHRNRSGQRHLPGAAPVR